MRKLLIPVLMVTVLAAAKAQDVYPTIPAGIVEKYSSKLVEERLETMLMERLLLDGKNPILMDFIPGHQFSKKNGVSAYFDIHFNPIFNTSMVVFPARGFAGGLSPENLNLYLQGEAKRASPGARFTILEEAEARSTGRAKFRILGIRALTVRYSVIADGESFTVGENWIEDGGTIFMVSVHAPSDDFDAYYDRISRAFRSMTRAN